VSTIEASGYVCYDVSDIGPPERPNGTQVSSPLIQERSVDLLITLDRSDQAAEGLTRQVYHQLRAAMLSGRLRAGERLPPTRDLARKLGVARLTVATAYDWLRAEGYVYGRVGAGTFVAAALGDLGGAHELSAAIPASPLPTPRQQTTGAGETPPVPLSAWARRIATIPLAGVGSDTDMPFNFSPGAGAAEAFPWARWRRSVGWDDPAERDAERLARARESAARVGQWDALLGPLETRQAIAAWLRRSRAVRCEPDQVLIAGSVQQVLSLLARLLMEPGQRLIVEDPSYVGFHAAFLAEGATLEGVPVDQNGITVDALPDPASARQREEAHLAVVTPSHQYPTGVTLALDRRLGLLDWARRAGVVVVEDDYDGDLRLEGQPLEALRGLDDRDEVIYLGTFAKALYPAVRLAYAVLPAWLVEPVARARAASDRHPLWRDALAVARFIDAGELERHLARMRRLYRARRDALVATLRTTLGDLVTIGLAEAGIHLLLGLPAGANDVAVSAAAREQGIGVTPLSPHYFHQARSGLLLGFGAMSEEQLARGIERLAPLIEREVARGQ
jgi:GntR family transcriptional regulator/MocR family aminotransferase